MNEETETMEEGVDDKEGLSDVMLALVEQQGTKLPDMVVEDEVVEGEETTEVVDDTPVPDYIFELDDGTKVTAEEAKKAYLRRADYTKKTQAVAQKVKDIDVIYEWCTDPAHPERMRNIFESIQGGVTEQKPQAPAPTQIPPVTIPEYLREDVWAVAMTANQKAQNEYIAKQDERIARIEGNQSATEKKTVETQRQTEQTRMLDTRLAQGYNELKGQVENPPTPKEFVAALTAHYEELGIPIETAKALILSPDPDYLSAKVNRIFAADISKAKQKEGETHEKDRKKRATTATNLRVAGKSQTVSPRTLPKGRDGKLDSKASLAMIMDEQDKLAGR